MFTALVALCAVLPGRLNATLNSTVAFQVELLEQTLDEIDSKLVESILKEASLKCGIDLTILVNQYKDGELTIEKQVTGYALVDAKSGGITIAIIDEF